MISNEIEGMLQDDRIATCGEQSHDDGEHGWNATYDDADL
jgi:hypothetical protein